ncbi:centrosomal protein of 85 kDa isoform X1 [Notechis scutatus]|uniref:Centrosomal protein of 85 kDa isoform X1 n=2 Tax=Notechis scutatus TaxID=8663 RepID=A0A6J1UVY9_9SAUR|nr:centrosomal protein of 85 kDa isoform X1 [Notechis scutatus]XP_026531800.1 centrosomal protein of 85 kDa isoform X1 [Notechis scutatus]
MAASGGTFIGAPPSSNNDASSSLNYGSSFQPIKTQVPIPTAHVMPSTLDRSTCLASELSSPQTTLASSMSNLLGNVGGLMSSYDSDTLRQSQVINRSSLCLNQTSAENGYNESLFHTSGQSGVEGVQKPISLDAEVTHSAFLNRHSLGPWSQLQMYTPDNSNSTSAGLEKEYNKILQNTKPPTDYNRVCGKQVSLGLNAASMFSTPLAAQSQTSKLEACTLHPHENCAHSAWKQHIDCVRLQLEQMHLQNKATCYYPLVNSTSLHTLDPAQWIGITNTNENLLLEKEILIDRQRQHISQLEQKLQESEMQVHSALYGHPAPYGDMHLFRMQELQSENIFLRAQFTEKTESLNKEKIELERKLAASEAGIKRIQETHKETTQKHTVELKKQEERIKSRDQHIEHLKKKCKKELDQNHEKQQRIEALERYIADLPVLEDHQKQSQQLKQSQKIVSTLQETVTTLERELRDVRSDCREKELQLEVQKHKEMELLSTVRSLQDKMQQMKPSIPEDYAQEIERERGEKESLHKERDLLRKIVENQKKKLDQLSSQIKDLEEQIAQDDGTAQALRAEALKQENALQQLRRAVKELASQNQELMEKNLTFQEHLRQMELGQLLSDETASLTQELHSELASCLQDLHSVYSVVTQRAQGKDPNLSLLLGIHTVHYSVQQEKDLLKPDMLAKKLEDVKQLHKEIEDLRTAISDRYAQDVGDNCITQ